MVWALCTSCSAMLGMTRSYSSSQVCRAYNSLRVYSKSRLVAPVGRRSRHFVIRLPHTVWRCAAFVVGDWLPCSRWRNVAPSHVYLSRAEQAVGCNVAAPRCKSICAASFHASIALNANITFTRGPNGICSSLGTVGPLLRCVLGSA